jgi:hypothetical protein
VIRTPDVLALSRTPAPTFPETMFFRTMFVPMASVKSMPYCSVPPRALFVMVLLSIVTLPLPSETSIPGPQLLVIRLRTTVTLVEFQTRLTASQLLSTWPTPRISLPSIHQSLALVLRWMPA